MKKGNRLLHEAIDHLYKIIDSKKGNRNLHMPGDSRYQPKQLIPLLGYDQWAGLLIIVEWFWLLTLAKLRQIPKDTAILLKKELLFEMLDKIITTKQDQLERITKHDILALLALMREILPPQLHRWLHFCATSYDIINSAYALQIRLCFESAFWPTLKEVDVIWRKKIKLYAYTLQIGRTHLQHALPITAGFWQANLHNRFVTCSRRARLLANEIPGKFTGAVGNSASQFALLTTDKGEETLMQMLGLPYAQITTQITPPEPTARFYTELAFLSGALANLGEDVRILQMDEVGEISSASSSSSAMSHKRANPIAAENVAGMHISVIAEALKTMLTLVSDLQRDLRWSNVMRSYSAAMVYNFQQILTTKRLLKSLKVDKFRCLENFNRNKKQIVAELLHLSLQKEGLHEAHTFVNEKIMPLSRTGNIYLNEAMSSYIESSPDAGVAGVWNKIPYEIESQLKKPETYLGKSVKLALAEANNKL